MAATFGPRPALLVEGGSMTYNDLGERMARYGRWTLQQGLAAGEVVCLLLPNCLDYVAIWLGITSVRGVVALINTHLTGNALVHAITAVAAKHVIVGPELQDALAEISHLLPPSIRSWSFGAATRWPRIDEHVNTLPSGPLGEEEQRPPALHDLALHIYTSGTTGLPKAANVTQRRVAEWSCWFAGMIDVMPNDRMYNCLPMYHSVGGVVSIGAMLVGGASVFIRPKFSASRFWDDVTESGCTLFQYIGELCRYLVGAPPHPRETEHHLRLCCGNGLRRDVWETFQRRFRIPRILEFYASTEGNVSLYNCRGRPGAIGHVPGFLAHRFPVVLVRSDPQTGIPERDADGRCILCEPNEIGEALGRIGDSAAAPGRPFEGYRDTAATAAKVVHDVLTQGDAWFRTGDLMRRDPEGFYYFIDRLGDTFRWNGENVATDEVTAVLRACVGVDDAAVFGVTVPGTEGRAGMAALVVNERFELAPFRRELESRLPDYARPVFLRLTASIAATSTFKPLIAPLARQGYDPDQVADPLYVEDRVQRSFVSLDRAMYARLSRGEFRV
jgi:fatty-acyl-CoA synthase